MKYEKKEYLFRANHSATNFYTPITNTLLQSELNPFTKGLFAEILSHSSTYAFHPTVYYEKYGRKKVEKAIKELIFNGYCKKVTINKYRVEFFFYEDPQPELIAQQAVNSGEPMPSTVKNHNIPDSDVREDHLSATPPIYPEDVLGVHHNDVPKVQQSDVPKEQLIINNLINNKLINIESNIVVQNVHPKTVLTGNQKQDQSSADVEEQPLLPSKQTSKIESNLNFEEKKRPDPVNRLFTISNRDAILKEFESTDWFASIPNRLKWFDKYHSFKSSKHPSDQTFTANQLYGGFKAFINGDSEFNAEKSRITRLELDRKNQIEKIRMLNIVDEIDKGIMRIDQMFAKDWRAKGYSLRDLTQFENIFLQAVRRNPNKIAEYEAQISSYIKNNLENFSRLADFITKYGRRDYQIMTKY